MLFVPDLLCFRSAEIDRPELAGFFKLASPRSLASKLMYRFDPWWPERFGQSVMRHLLQSLLMISDAFAEDVRRLR